ADIVDVVAKENLTEYPELTEKLAYIKKVVATEEDRFAATIDAGLSILSNMIREALDEGRDSLSGDDIFKLYDTFGFPIDLTREIAAEQHLILDEETFKSHMKVQRERARAARANISGWSEASKDLLSGIEKTEFLGYTENSCEATVKAIIVDGESVDEVTEGDFSLIFDRTVFYGESGGQVGDTGTVIDADTVIAVTDVKKSDGVFVHLCSCAVGDIKVGDKVKLEINVSRREAIRRNHSSAHLLQSALRSVLGNHVEQAGSFVNESRVRFDFSHFAAMTEEELVAVEAMVNAHILLGEEVDTKVMDIEDAKASGAMALFGEKYGDKVRVVKMGNFSTELCGGTHVDNTGKVGLFKIISESSVAAGVRRIEGTTGLGVLELMHEKDLLIADTARELKANSANDIAKKSAQLQGEIKTLKHEIDELNAKIASSQTASMLQNAKNVGSVRVIVSELKGVAPDVARAMTDKFKAEQSDMVTGLALTGDGLKFVVSCGPDAVKAGAHAGNIAKAAAAMTGGNGGGRPDSAMSGGKDMSKLAETLAAIPSIVEGMLK
ncbi:MAG: alanine--tRNA ligase, partial [Clostridia bacterium]|nr:alanine--tRNA ligase [Clostridia bacterium]